MYFASTYNSLSVPLNFQATGLYNLIGCFFCFSHIRCSLHLPLRFPFCLPRPHLSCFLSLYFSDIIIHIFQPLINLLILSLFHSPPHLPRTSPPLPPKNVLRFHCCSVTGRHHILLDSSHRDKLLCGFTFVNFIDSFMKSMIWCLIIRLCRVCFYPSKFINCNNNPIRATMAETASLDTLKTFCQFNLYHMPGNDTSHKRV